MVSNYRAPGVYVEEISNLPPSVVAVETAIPVFIGYTQRTQYRGQPLVHTPLAVESLLEFQEIFGGPPPIGNFIIALDVDGNIASAVEDPQQGSLGGFRLAHALRHFYDNGGGRCYIVSLGDYSSSSVPADIAAAHGLALEAVAREDEPTLLVMPDLSGMAPTDPTDAAEVASVRAAYHGVLTSALAQCAELRDRFLVCDLWDGDQPGTAGIDAFRNGIGTRNLEYGAAYHPFIQTTIGWPWNESTISVAQPAGRDDAGTVVTPGPVDGATLSELRGTAGVVNTAIYSALRAALDRFSVTLPPAAAVAGIYATVDVRRGVWKTPANESVNSVRSLSVDIDRDLNEQLNVHPTGKSINVLRFFTGKGFLVWGGRTLAGNSNEWRYVSVRRFFNMVEESVKKATEPFVFEPNDPKTWSKVKAMVENFLVIQWRQGALAGAKPEDAFFVRIGLGSTMTPLDVLEGRMNVEIGMAAVRPAEFVILRFSHIMQRA
jgi:uncharacterized protein